MSECGEVEQLKQDYDEVDTALMEVAEDRDRLRKSNTALLADREALVRYLRDRNALAINVIPELTMKLAKVSTASYDALSQELRNVIEEEGEL